VATTIDDKKERTYVLVAVAEQLEGEERRQCLRQALVAAIAIANEEDRAHALAAVAGQLEGEERRQCLRQALAAATAAPSSGGYHRHRSLVAH